MFLGFPAQAQQAPTPNPGLSLMALNGSSLESPLLCYRKVFKEARASCYGVWRLGVGPAFTKSVAEKTGALKVSS